MMKDKILIAGAIVAIMLVASLTAIGQSNAYISYETEMPEKESSLEKSEDINPLETSTFRYLGMLSDLGQDEDGKWTGTVGSFLVMIAFDFPPYVVKRYSAGDQVTFPDPGGFNWKLQMKSGNYFIWPLVSY